MKKLVLIVPILCAIVFATVAVQIPRNSLPAAPLQHTNNPQALRVVQSAQEQLQYTRYYDPAYVVLAYPNGDVPRDRGVCTDVVIRAFRAAGVDLQKEIHEDMTRDFAVYPNMWGLSRPDPNIDHRRVPNMMTFLDRRNASLTISAEAQNYLPGDVVAWRLDNGRLHVGIVTTTIAENQQAYLVAHNVGSGVQEQDVLFRWTLIGHYRYFRDSTQQHNAN